MARQRLRGLPLLRAIPGEQLPLDGRLRRSRGNQLRRLPRRAEDGTGFRNRGLQRRAPAASLARWDLRLRELSHRFQPCQTRPSSAENVKPPYYANPAGHTAIPTDPCNPPDAYVEDFQGTTIGLDNDGNGQFDMADAACSGVPVNPGEASKASAMLVTAYDKLSGNVDDLLRAGCAATDSKIEYGPLSALSTYGYSGQVCALGTTGAATFGVPNGSFFLVVGTTTAREGSYGTKSRCESDHRAAARRGQRVVLLTQDLANRCDP